MDAEREWNWQHATGCSAPAEASRLLLEQGTRIAALEQHISDLEKSLENVRNAEEAWRKRVEAAADALADVLPGEVGRLDLLARIAELKRLCDGYGKDLKQHIRAGVEVAEILDGGLGFIGEGIVAGAQRVVAERDKAREELVALRAEMGRLEQEVSQWMGQAKTNGTERDAAVADNAALVAWVNYHGHAEWCPQNHNDKLEGCHEACAAHPVFTEPHPGAALLEEHRKALVRARNEGLEDAALNLRGECDYSGAPDCDCDPCVHARDIRAMKEPEG